MSEPLSESDRERLFEKALEGNGEALVELISSYQNILHQDADQQLGNKIKARVGASDIVQETYDSALHNFAGQFRGNGLGEFVGWLREINNHNVLDQVRRHNRAGRDVAREEPAPDSAALARNELIGRCETPSQVAIRNETRQAVLAALQDLTDGQRAVLTRRILESKSIREIGEELDLSETAVAGLLKRGLEKTRARLARILRNNEN